MPHVAPVRSRTGTHCSHNPAQSQGVLLDLPARVWPPSRKAHRGQLISRMQQAIWACAGRPPPPPPPCLRSSKSACLPASLTRAPMDRPLPCSGSPSMESIKELLEALTRPFGCVAPTLAAAEVADCIAAQLSGLALGGGTSGTDAAGLDRWTLLIPAVPLQCICLAIRLNAIRFVRLPAGSSRQRRTPWRILRQQPPVPWQSRAEGRPGC